MSRGGGCGELRSPVWQVGLAGSLRTRIPDPGGLLRAAPKPGVQAWGLGLLTGQPRGQGRARRM